MTKRKRPAKAAAPKASNRFVGDESDYDETGKPLRIRTPKTKRTDAKTQSKKKKAVKSKTAPVEKPAKKAKKSVKKTGTKPLAKKKAPAKKQTKKR